MDRRRPEHVFHLMSSLAVERVGDGCGRKLKRFVSQHLDSLGLCRGICDQQRTENKQRQST